MDESFHPGKPAAGFTLLEVLLVVLIIGILATAGANLLASQSIERQIMAQAQIFEADLTHLCERAVLENQAFGIEWQTDGYQALRHQAPEWLSLEREATQWSSGVQAEFFTQGRRQIMAKDYEGLPHIVCQTDGSFTEFELRLAADESNHYALKTTSPWQLSGGWHQP